MKAIVACFVICVAVALGTQAKAADASYIGTWKVAGAVGAFEEMQSKNKSVDPDKLAASLGFVGKNIKTLETGCEIDFHFVDAATAEIGLNDAVYTLKKQ